MGDNFFDSLADYGYDYCLEFFFEKTDVEPDAVSPGYYASSHKDAPLQQEYFY